VRLFQHGFGPGRPVVCMVIPRFCGKGIAGEPLSVYVREQAIRCSPTLLADVTGALGSPICATWATGKGL